MCRKQALDNGISQAPSNLLKDCVLPRGPDPAPYSRVVHGLARFWCDKVNSDPERLQSDVMDFVPVAASNLGYDTQKVMRMGREIGWAIWRETSSEVRLAMGEPTSQCMVSTEVISSALNIRASCVLQ